MHNLSLALKNNHHVKCQKLWILRAGTSDGVVRPVAQSPSRCPLPSVRLRVQIKMREICSKFTFSCIQHVVCGSRCTHSSLYMYSHVCICIFLCARIFSLLFFSGFCWPQTVGRQCPLTCRPEPRRTRKADRRAGGRSGVQTVGRVLIWIIY